MAFSLDPVPPFRLDLTAWAIRRRPENLIDRWDGDSYRRVLAIGQDALQVTVTQSGGEATPKLHIVAASAGRRAVAKAKVIAGIERLLGIRVELDPFYRVAARDARLHELMSRFRGSQAAPIPNCF